MLLHAIFTLTSLLNGAPAPAAVASTQDGVPSLAWSIPEDTVFAVRWNDPKGVLENDLENAWIAFLSDPRWLELDALEDLSMDEENLAMFVEYVLPTLLSSSEIVLWMEDFTNPEPDVYFALRATEETTDRLAEMILSKGGKLNEEGDFPIIAEDTLAYSWSQGVGLFSFTGDPEVNWADIRSTMTSLLGQTEPAGVFESTPLNSDRNPEQLELLLNLGPVFEMMAEEDDEMADLPQAARAELDGVQWLYASCVFGEGEKLDATFVMPYLEGGYMDQFFAFAGEADMDAFSRVPADAIGASVGNFDLPGAIAWILEQVVEEGITTEEEVEAGIADMEEAIGVHIFDDLIDYLTGDYLQIIFPVESYDKELQSLVATSYGLIMAGVSSAQEVEASLSSILDVAAGFVQIEEDEASWGTVWGIDVMGMFDLQIGTHSDSMFLCAHPDALDMFQEHLTAGSDAPSFKTLPGADSILTELGGAYAYLYRTPALFEVASSVFENMPELEEDPDMAMFLELIEYASEIAGDNFTGMIGSSVTFDGRMRATTIAR